MPGKVLGQASNIGPSLKLPSEISMQCSDCGSDRIEKGSPLAVEHWQCLACGHEMAVRCHYLPDPSKIPLPAIFRGRVSLSENQNALKAFLKLKIALSFAERFQPVDIEAQYQSGSREWILGDFLDFEVDRARSACKHIGLDADFEALS